MNHKNIMFYLKSSLTILVLAIVLVPGCTPERIDEMSLDGTPGIPEFTAVPLADNPNRIILKASAQNSFQLLWDLPGATPKVSRKTIDTVLYAKAGVYKIKLVASSTDGSGTGTNTKTITIAQDAPLSCNPKLSLLTGECKPEGKCWTMSTEVGAVKVGPTYDDYSWFTSPVNGLQPQQYDDRFCFTFENLVFENKNNGLSVNPWDGYKPVVADWAKSQFTYTEGTGTNGRDQITLEDLQFMGVWDCDNVLDVMLLTETKLIVRGKQREPNGTPKSEGWFELTFKAN
ncbi:MAG: PKD domain-containing protein [Saprospiraceae bacterium]|nr:PKD domain-containing protein [Saprospiraceae bacterium]